MAFNDTNYGGGTYGGFNGPYFGNVGAGNLGGSGGWSAPGYGAFGGYGASAYQPDFPGTVAGQYSNFFGAGYTFNPYQGSYIPSNFGSGYQMGQNLSDQDIERSLNDTLDANPATAHADIKVQSKDHVITLTGTARNKHVKIIAGDMAWMTSGVRDVNNNIQVKPRNQQAQGQQTEGPQTQEQQRGTQTTGRQTRPAATASGTA